MKYRRLGKTGLQVSVIGVGTWQLGGEWGKRFERGEVDAEAIQVVYNRIQRDAEKEILPSCRRQDLGVLTRVPLASGFLSGKYTEKASFPKSDVRAVWQSDEERQRFIEQAEQIKRTEVPEGVPMTQWALAWCLRNPAVSCVIPGCKNVAQMESNAQAADLLPA
jgi:aryl-alcohol dehydrogenase-like predicted oxidoreductase